MRRQRVAYHGNADLYFDVFPAKWEDEGEMDLLLYILDELEHRGLLNQTDKRGPEAGDAGPRGFVNMNEPALYAVQTYILDNAEELYPMAASDEVLDRLLDRIEEYL